MTPNMLITALAALVPLIIGAIWYNPKVFGTTWIKATGLTEEELRKANMVKVFSLTYILSFLLALALNAVVIHQFHVYSIFMNDPGMSDPNSPVRKEIADFMSKNGHNFRTFKHGALHGSLTGIFIALPITGIIALFERKSFKYVAVHTGFWIVCMALMGGIICQWT